jgi:hypothetical protein
MKMTKKITDRDRLYQTINRGILAVVLIVVAVPVASAIYPLLQYGFYYVKCGHQPVKASNFAAGYTYTMPGSARYAEYHANVYFCSEQEAISHGFSNKR